MRNNTWSCSNCGSTNGLSSRYCTNCGAEIPRKITLEIFHEQIKLADGKLFEFKANKFNRAAKVQTRMIKIVAVMMLVVTVLGFGTQAIMLTAEKNSAQTSSSAVQIRHETANTNALTALSDNRQIRSENDTVTFINRFIDISKSNHRAIESSKKQRNKKHERFKKGEFKKNGN